MKRTRLRFLWQDNRLTQQFRTGVSLHSHTMHSRESLAFIPRYAKVFPPLAWELARQARKYKQKFNRELDYTRAYWTPPLPAAQAFALEKQGIERALGLTALVSISDHDNIEAAAQLRLLQATGHAPVSMEWTVPFGSSYFHLGIHNIPPVEAESLVAELNRFTHNPSDQFRNDLLAVLGSRPDTLVVLNHPLWDQSGVGAAVHRSGLSALLASSREFIHALELNGLRSWEENQQVIDLASASDLTLVSGGDRHGCEAASVVNVTDASGFAEFAAEVRTGQSDIAFLHHYREPVRSRLLRSVCDIMGTYPDLTGRERWSDRVFCQRYTGEARALSEMCNGQSPVVVRYFERLVRLAGKSEFQHLPRRYFGSSGDPEHQLPLTEIPAWNRAPVDGRVAPQEE